MGPLGAVAFVIDNKTMAHTLAGRAGDATEVPSGLPVLADEFMRDIVLDAFQGIGGIRARTVDEHANSAETAMVAFAARVIKLSKMLALALWQRSWMWFG